VGVRSVRRKREGRVFFSEEKKHKTFVSAPAEISSPWPRLWEWRRSKSFLVLFFKKERLSGLAGSCALGLIRVSYSIPADGMRTSESLASRAWAGAPARLRTRLVGDIFIPIEWKF